VIFRWHGQSFNDKREAGITGQSSCEVGRGLLGSKCNKFFKYVVWWFLLFIRLPWSTQYSKPKGLPYPTLRRSTCTHMTAPTGTRALGWNCVGGAILQFQYPAPLTSELNRKSIWKGKWCLSKMSKMQKTVMGTRWKLSVHASQLNTFVRMYTKLVEILWKDWWCPGMMSKSL